MQAWTFHSIYNIVLRKSNALWSGKRKGMCGDSLQLGDPLVKLYMYTNFASSDVLCMCVYKTLLSVSTVCFILYSIVFPNYCHYMDSLLSLTVALEKMLRPFVYAMKHLYTRFPT